MEVIFALPIIMVPFLWPVLTGLMAKSFGRKFWFWFFMGIPLPFVANIILLCLPDKKKKIKQISNNEIKPVSNEEIFNHLSGTADSTSKNKQYEVYFSASA